MREWFKELFDGIKQKFATFRERSKGMSLADGLRNAGTTLGPMAQRGLLRMPSLDETLQKVLKYEWAIWALAGLLAADLTMTGLGNLLGAQMPKTATPIAAPSHRVVKLEPFVRSIEEYNPVLTTNPFCPGCPIPDITKLQRPKDCALAKPLTSASLKLIGTIVLSDPKYSVATIQRGADSVAVQKGDNMSGVGEVYEIRQGRVCFVVGTGALQFIDMPSDMIEFNQAPLPVSKPSAKFAPSLPGIEQVSETEFAISRDALNKKLEDPLLLTEALAMPYRPDGELKGFKIASIKPGSVYESLGVQVGDIVSGVNGEPMNSVAKAQELFVSLRTQDRISITFNRNGQDVTQTYTIR
jgi:general secretion pathway protein C